MSLMPLLLKASIPVSKQTLCSCHTVQYSHQGQWKFHCTSRAHGQRCRIHRLVQWARGQSCSYRLSYLTSTNYCYVYPSMPDYLGIADLHIHFLEWVLLHADHNREYPWIPDITFHRTIDALETSPGSNQNWNSSYTRRDTRATH